MSCENCRKLEARVKRLRDEVERMDREDDTNLAYLKSILTDTATEGE